MNRGFDFSLLEKLLCDDESRRSHVSVSQLKDSVAADVECLLNSRRGISDDLLRDFSNAQRSVVNYGLRDFVSLSLSNREHRQKICQDIRQCLLTYEPRLYQPVVELTPDENAVRQLRFSIRAVLIAKETKESVQFDAVLQSTTMQYQITRGS